MYGFKGLITLLFLSILSFYIQAQTPSVQKALGAHVIVSNVIDNEDGTYVVTANWSDETNVYGGQDLQLGHVLWSRATAIGDDCNRFVVDSLIQRLIGRVTVRVAEQQNDGQPASGTDNAFIQETSQGLPHWISGVSDPLNQCISSYFADRVSSNGSAGGIQVVGSYVSQKEAANNSVLTGQYFYVPFGSSVYSEGQLIRKNFLWLFLFFFPFQIKTKEQNL